jgi:carbon monoxide dehydrogenase subunit G
MLLSFALALMMSPPALPPADLARALEGEIVVRSEPSVTPAGKTAGYGIGAIAIDKSIEDTWKVLSNYTDKAQYQPRVDTCTILGREGNTLRVAMAIDAGIMTATYTGLYTLDPAAHSVHWTLDRQAPGNNIADMDGSYWLVKVSPVRTILYFRSYVDSGHLVPRFIQNHFSIKAIPDLLKAIKQRVESNGTYHK